MQSLGNHPFKKAGCLKLWLLLIPDRNLNPLPLKNIDDEKDNISHSIIINIEFGYLRANTFHGCE